MTYQPPRPQAAAPAPEAPRRSWRGLVMGGAALVLVLGGYWYFTHESAPRPVARRETAAPVRVARAERRDMAVVEHTIGTVIANSTVQVTARVQGQLQAAYFKEGDMVKKGQLLFQIDPRPYQAVYDNAEAAMVNAKNNAERSANLLRQNATAAQTDDNNQAAYQIARANAEAARLNLEFTRITSPVNGKTGPILVQPGNQVTASASVGASALVNITEIQPIKVSFSLPQADLPRIQARAHMPGGLTAQIVLHDAGGKDLRAPVDFISNAVAGSSGTIELRADFPNQDASLVPGQLVDVVVELANLPGALVVPREALNTGPDGQFIYSVSQDMRVEQHTVKVLFDDGAFAAISSDLHEGDHVITDGSLRVIPGGKVTIVRGDGAATLGGRGGRGGRRGGGGGGRRGEDG